MVLTADLTPAHWGWGGVVCADSKLQHLTLPPEVETETGALFHPLAPEG